MVKSTLLLGMMVLVPAFGCGSSSTEPATTPDFSKVSISGIPANTGLVPGDTFLLKLTVFDSLGTAVPSTGSVSWSTSDPAVATVDATGKAIMRAAGSATIRATLTNDRQSLSDSVKITVATIHSA